MANIAATQTNNSDEWGTPLWLLNLIQKRFNYGLTFDLDPAATAENSKALSYYDKEQDGLKKSWYGAVFINPPYSEIGKWVKKASEEAYHRNATVTMLISARTDTRWWWDYVRYGDVHFIKGRIKFVDPVRGIVTSAPFPSAVVHFAMRPSWPGMSYWEIDKELRQDE